LTPRDFIFWLQGHMEINDPETITEAQAAMIKEHLDLTISELSKKKLNQPQPASQTGGMGGSASTVNPFGTMVYTNAMTTPIC
jgi:hypothetical protein